MKRILITEGDGKAVRRVAQKYVAQVRVYVETDYNNRPTLVLNVRPDGTWTLDQQGHGTVAFGSIEPAPHTTNGNWCQCLNCKDPEEA